MPQPTPTKRSTEAHRPATDRSGGPAAGKKPVSAATGGQSKRNGGPPEAPSAAETRLSQFKANPHNPRKISDEQLDALKKAMAAYGDLSGVVVNLSTGNMIGGHQRVKILGDAKVEILRRFAKPTPRGTVAEGVVHYDGERFIYREVKWDAATEQAAMIAANKHGGDWDIPELSALLMDLDASGYELPLTGFSAKELEAMLTKLVPDTDDDAPVVDVGDGVLPAHIRMVQLFLTVDSLPPFMEKVRLLGEKYGMSNITDTVCHAVEVCYAQDYGNAAPAPPLAPDAELGAEGGRSVQLDAASVGAETAGRKEV